MTSFTMVGPCNRPNHPTLLPEEEHDELGQAGSWTETAECGIDPRLLAQQLPELDMSFPSPDMGSEHYSSPITQAPYNLGSNSQLQQQHSDADGILQFTKLDVVQHEQGYGAFPQYSDTEFQALAASWNDTTALQPGAQAVLQQSASFVPPPLGPNAQHLVPQFDPRPRLHLETSPSQLTPTSLEYQQALPTSAPAIRVYDTDATLAQHNNDAAPSQFSARRRAASAPRTMLSHHEQYVTAPEYPVYEDLLSPVTGWLRNSQPRTLVEIDGGLPVPLGMNLSMPSTPSRSRSSSVASSAASSSGGWYACDHAGCSKSYTKRAKLNHHRRCHLPYHLRRHVCEFCGKRFLFPKELVRHNLSASHTVPQFHCSTCGNAFGRPDHLSRHMSVHNPRERASSLGSTSIAGSNPWTAGSSTNPEHSAMVDFDFGTPMSDFDVGGVCASVEHTFADQMDLDDDSVAQVNEFSPPSPSPLPRGRDTFR